MKRTLTVLFVALVSMLIIVSFGCNGKSNPLSGTTWVVSVFGTPFGTWKFKADGNVEMKVTEEGEETEASIFKYEVKGESVFFSEDESCPDAVGEYNYKIDGDSLTFEMVKDDCEGRPMGMSMMTFSEEK